MIIIRMLLDQITKIFANIYKPNIDIIPDFFSIQYIENTGTIFGLLKNSNYLFAILSFIVCIIIALYMKKKVTKKTFEEKVLMLVLAGGIGNIIDRIARGFVVDFIAVKYIGVFNFSDIYIVVGVILLIINLIKNKNLDNDFSK